MDLSVVIPCYDEERRLPGSLEQLREYLAAQSGSLEFVLVDDGSTDGADVAFGSRAARGAREIDQPLHRRVMGRLFNLLVRAALLPGICIRLAGYRIQEIPVRWRNSEATRVSPVRHSVQMLGDLLWLRLLQPGVMRRPRLGDEREASR